MDRKACLPIVFVVGVTLLLIAGPVQAQILVGGYASTTINQYDEAGTYQGAFATTSAPYLVSPYGTCLGPDGYVYAAYAGNWNGSDGGILKLKADGSTPVGAGAAFGSLTYALAVHWGPDGYLYVNSGAGIRRMDASGTLDTTWNGGNSLTGGSNAGLMRDITTRDNGNGTFGLYFATTVGDNSTGQGEVICETINDTTGAILGQTSYNVPTVGGVTAISQHVQFGPDGLLYVSSTQNLEIWRANLSDATPTFAPFIPGGGVFGLGFDWDGSGGLLVTYGSDILKYDASTGNFDGYWAHGVSGAQSILAIPEPGTLVLLVTSLIGILAYAWRKRK